MLCHLSLRYASHLLTHCKEMLLLEESEKFVNIVLDVNSEVNMVVGMCHNSLGFLIEARMVLSEVEGT